MNQMLRQFLTKRIPVDKELKALLEISDQLERGALIKYGEIETATRLEKDTAAWAKVIRLWRKATLEKRQIVITCESGVGYRLATVNDQVDVGGRLEKQADRRMHKAAVVVGVIPAELLNEEGLAFQSKFVDQAGAVRQSIKENRAERKTLLIAFQPLPKHGIAKE
jgi:hypothetical protein